LCQRVTSLATTRARIDSCPSCLKIQVKSENVVESHL
jgi:hypothetical protein